MPDDHSSLAEPLPVPDPTPAAEQNEARRRVRQYAKNRRARATRTGARWVLAIAILQLVFGVAFGLKHQKEAETALANLSTLAEDEVVTTGDGEETTVAELRVAVEREQARMFAVPIGLGVVFLGLWQWARRSPIPALSTALGLFVAVHAADALFDPTAILRGILIKVLCVLGLVNGIRSALQQRAMDADEQQAAT